MKKKRLKLLFSLMLVIALAAGVTYAVFNDRAAILGTSFSVGSADIKLLNDLALGTDLSNLVDEKIGPTFTGISPNWSKDYLIKIYNNAPTDVLLSTHANYETSNDPDELRQVIFVEPIVWNDADNDGAVDEGEAGNSLGRKTIVKWKTEGFDLGSLSAGGVKSMILRLSTDSVSSSKQGKSAVIDFEFDAGGVE